MATNSPIWTLLDWRRLSSEDSLDVVVRRPAGMTPEMLDARLRPGLTEYAARLSADRRQLMLAVSGIEGTPLARQVSFVLPYVLGVAVLLTLLIACANVAVLMMPQWTARIMGQEMMVGTAPLFPLIGIGMLLTMAGIYGVLAFAVARRARELAVRVALGATERDLARLVTMQTVRLAGVGIVLGLGLMFGLATIVRAGGGAGSVFDASLSAFVAPAAAIMGIAVAATWLPARRAASIEPATFLRAQ